MVSPQRKIGDLGEDIACKYLKEKGYKILEKNYERKTQVGPLLAEIDIVAKKKKVVYFIEIKSAAKENKNFPLEQRVDYKKQQKLIKASQDWLFKNKMPPDTKRQIDIITVILNFDSKKAKIQHFKNIIY